MKKIIILILITNIISFIIGTRFELDLTIKLKEGFADNPQPTEDISWLKSNNPSVWEALNTEVE